MTYERLQKLKRILQTKIIKQRQNKGVNLTLLSNYENTVQKIKLVDENGVYSKDSKDEKHI